MYIYIYIYIYAMIYIYIYICLWGCTFNVVPPRSTTAPLYAGVHVCVYAQSHMHHLVYEH